jgi:hypothetical protein
VKFWNTANWTQQAPKLGGSAPQTPRSSSHQTKFYANNFRGSPRSQFRFFFQSEARFR